MTRPTRADVLRCACGSDAFLEACQLNASSRLRLDADVVQCVSCGTNYVPTPMDEHDRTAGFTLTPWEAAQ